MNDDKKFNPNFFTSRPEEVGNIVKGLEKVASDRSKTEEGYVDNSASASAREAMRIHLLAETGASEIAFEEFDEAIGSLMIEKTAEQYPGFSEEDFSSNVDRYRLLSQEERAKLRKDVFESVGFVYSEDGTILEFPLSFGDFVDSLAFDQQTGEMLIITGWAGHNEAKNRLSKKYNNKVRGPGSSSVIGGYIVKEVPGWQIPFVEVSFPPHLTDEQRLKIGQMLAKNRRFLPVDWKTFELLV